MAGAHLSREFFDLIKSIGEAKSKQEEDRIVVAEVADSKKKTGDRTLTGKKLKEYLLRLVYVEMLGHDASFGYMKAVELSASSNLLEKRVAYLCAGLCFSPEHEFRMMLVNRLQRDLQSANVLEISIALSASAKILTADMIPAVLPIVTNLLKHDQEIVRKKTVMLLHRFLQLAPESISHMSDKFRRALCDKDPSVMGASLHLFAEMVRLDPAPYKDLVPSFVSILKQVVEHRLPRDFDYHRVPAPWLQMKMLRILAAQGRADQASSEQMYEVLLDVIRRGDTGTNVGYAILYECVKTVTTIYPNAALLDAAAGSIARFITSESHNLKYLGVTGLAAIVKDHPKYAAEHQMAVIDCLEDPDDTLKRKTLDLLYRMINPVNVEVIVAKLLDHLSSASDTFLRTDLVTRITSAAERFAPSNVWYVTTIAAAFELGGDLVKPEVATNLIRLISEGGGESAEADSELRRSAVETLMGLVGKPHLPNVLLQTLFWVVGEYGALVTTSGGPHTLTSICEVIAELAGRTGLDVPTRGHALAALAKLTSLVPPHARPSSLETLTQKLSASRHADLAQRVAELKALLVRPQLMAAVLPYDASTEDVDASLNFLDSFVAQAASAGARAYSKPLSESDLPGAGAEGVGGLRFDAYERNEGNFNIPDDSGASLGGMGAGGSGGGGTQTLSLAGAVAPGQKAGGMWGKEGYKSSTGTVLSEGKVEGPKGGSAGPWGTAASSTSSGSSSSSNTSTPAQAAPGVGSNSSSASLKDFVSTTPPAPRELTEKEKMAAALFGGLGGAAGSKAPAAAAGASKTAATGVTGVNTVAPTLGAAGKTLSAPPPPAVKTVAASVVAPTPPAPSSTLDLLDLFSSPTPTPAVGLGLSSAPARDPFGGGGGGLDPFAPVAATPVDLFASLSPPHGLLASFPALACRAGEVRTPVSGVQKLTASGPVALGAVKFAAPEGLHVLLYAVNSSTTHFPGLQMAVTSPPFLTARYNSASGGAVEVGSGGGIPLGPLAPGASTSLLITLSLCAVPGAGVLSVQYSTGGMGAHSGSSNLELAVSDVLRPAPLDTPSFGAVWTQPAMSGEATVVVPASQYSSPDALLARVPAMRFNPIQAIAATQEAISAARVMAMPNVYALLHTRSTPGGLELRVRTPDKGFSGAVLDGLVKLLK